jgi:dTDP-4-dehydrorhamnose 3,5-epimerase
MGVRVEKTPIAGLVTVEPEVYPDARGYFMESYNRRDFQAAGIDVDFVQDNQARSVRGTLRGLHFQRTHPQAKLVRVLSGRVFDVAVDLRESSQTFGRWHGVTLDAESHRQFFIPAGFAHGYLVLSDTAVFAYKCSDFYHPEDEGGLRWDDPDVGIRWPLEGIGQPLLSEKDRRMPVLEDLEFRYP